MSRKRTVCHLVPVQANNKFRRPPEGSTLFFHLYCPGNAHGATFHPSLKTNQQIHCWRPPDVAVSSATALAVSGSSSRVADAAEDHTRLASFNRPLGSEVSRTCQQHVRLFYHVPGECDCPILGGIRIPIGDSGFCGKY